MRAPLLALLLACACDPREFKCMADNQCLEETGAFGLCLESHCAFLDENCASRYRWDDTAGSDAKKCVDRSVLPPDAGVDARPVDAALRDAP